MIALRRAPHAAEQARGPVWLQRVRQGLNPRVVGGVPLEEFVPGPPRCPDCNRVWTADESADAFFHVMLPMPCSEKPPAERRSEPRGDRRRRDRRSAAAA